MAGQDIGVVVPTVVVQGVRETLREFRKFDRKLVNTAQAKFARRVGSSLQRTAGDLVRSSLRYGDRPMNNWYDRGRLGWNTNRVIKGFKVDRSQEQKYRKNTVTFNLLAFRQQNAAGMLFDWAGRSGKYVGKSTKGRGATRLSSAGSERRGVAFINNAQANIKFGSIKGSKYSRTVFPAIVRNRETIVGELQMMVTDLEREMTRRLGG